MAFQGPSGYQYCELKALGLPRLSLGTRRKTDARRLEASIREVHRLAVMERADYFKLLDALKPRGRGRQGRLSAQDLHVALRTRSLDDLLRRLDEKTFRAVFEAYEAGHGLTASDRKIERILLEMIGDEPFSTLCESAQLDALFARIEQERAIKPGSVRRNYGQLLSKILRWKLGAARRDTVFGALTYTGEDLARELRRSVVTYQAIARLLDELEASYQNPGDECARLYAEIAISQGATVKALARSKNINFDVVHIETLPMGEYRLVETGGERVGRLYLTGTKNFKTKQGRRNRDRYIWIARDLLERMVHYHQPDRPDELLFPLRGSRFDTIFQKARRRAGLMRAARNDTPIRPHDLRSVYAMLAEEAGIEATVISRGGLGHTSPLQSARYLQRDVMMHPHEVNALLERVRQAS